MTLPRGSLTALRLPVYRGAVKRRRILIKLSGEFLRDSNKKETICAEKLSYMAEEVRKAQQVGCQIAIVIGGGNIFRGRIGKNEQPVDRNTADYMGMLATMINGLALMGALEQLGISVRVQSALSIKEIAEPFIPRRAVRHLEKGDIVIFIAGTGSPYFSTDTAAALRANEIHADIILKATQVDGIYDQDPKKHPKARRFEHLTFKEALQNRYGVMDSTAFSLCMDNGTPILVFNALTPNNILRAAQGEQVGTLVATMA